MFSGGMGGDIGTWSGGVSGGGEISVGVGCVGKSEVWRVLDVWSGGVTVDVREFDVAGGDNDSVFGSSVKFRQGTMGRELES